MATSEEYAQWIVKNKDKKGSKEFATVAAAYQDARANERSTPVVDKPQPEGNYWDEVKGGIASAPINAYLGVKQMLPGGLDDTEKSVLQMNKEAASKAPIASFAGNVAMAAPTALIPGANTVTGAGLIGAAQGLIQPADNTGERLMNVGVGGVAGAGGQKLVGMAGNKLSSMLANSDAKAATQNAINAPKQTMLDEFRGAGYVTPPSAVNPSFINKRLESIAGKAAVGQEAAYKNQSVTDALTRKAAGLAEDEPLSSQALQSIRSDNGKVYAEVGKLSSIAKQDVEALKQARFDANAYYKHYNRSADPSSLVKAKDAKDLVDQLEASIETEARSAGRPELVNQLKEARKSIAKSYDIERGLNDTLGEASAPTFGAMLKKGRPLTGELKTIGQFQQSFPSYAREGAKIPTPGVSKVEGLAALALGAGGVGIGGPAGALLGATPLLSGPVRSLVLSAPYQKLMANYAKENSPKTLKAMAAMLNNGTIKGMTPALSSKLATSSLSETRTNKQE